jgi:hypothetical protein
MQPDDEAVLALWAHKKQLEQGSGKYILIHMPDGTACKAYLPFYVSEDAGHEVVGLEFSTFGALALIIESHLDPNGDTAQALAF